MFRRRLRSFSRIHHESGRQKKRDDSLQLLTFAHVLQLPPQLFIFVLDFGQRMGSFERGGRGFCGEGEEGSIGGQADGKRKWRTGFGQLEISTARNDPIFCFAVAKGRATVGSVCKAVVRLRIVDI